MKCFVINLSRAIERKQFISKQLNQIHQNFEIFEGVDWRELTHYSQPKISRSVKLINSYRRLTPGEIGCNLSHRKILNNLADSSEKMIAVLEDDIRISSELKTILNEIEESTVHFDIVFLGTAFNGRGLVQIEPLNNRYYFSLSLSREVGTWGYVITRKAAIKFLEKIPDVQGPIDDALHAYWYHGLMTYILHPQLVFHEEVGKKFSYVEELPSIGLTPTERVTRLFPKYFERYSRKFHRYKIIKQKKISKDY